MIGWRRLTERRRLKALERTFRDARVGATPGVPIRVTAHGLWTPTPFAVLAALFRTTRACGFFESQKGGRSTVLDAGMGDGRVLAALVYFEPELEVLGLESDAGLFHLAVTNLENLHRSALVTRSERLRLGRGDYGDLSTYESIGVRPEDISFVVNYPDGNQHELERFVVERAAPGAKLCLLTHDRELRLARLDLISKEPVVVSDSAEKWHWSVYSSRGGRT